MESPDSYINDSMYTATIKEYFLRATYSSQKQENSNNLISYEKQNSWLEKWCFSNFGLTVGAVVSFLIYEAHPVKCYNGDITVLHHVTFFGGHSEFWLGESGPTSNSLHFDERAEAEDRRRKSRR